jgi:hypothetical protein
MKITSMSTNMKTKNTKRVRLRYRKHGRKPGKAFTQKVWRNKPLKRTNTTVSVSNPSLSLHDATLKVRHLYDTVRDFDVESVYKWRNMRKRVQRGKPVHDGGGTPAEDAQAKLDLLNKKLEDARKLQETLKQQLEETEKAVDAVRAMKTEIKSEMEATKEGATPDDPDCVEYQGQPTFLVKKKPGGPDEYDVSRVDGDTFVDGSLTRLAESLIGRAKEVGGVDEDGEDAIKADADADAADAADDADADDAAKAASLDALAEEMIKIALDALDALDKVDAFEGAKQLTDDKILEQAAAAIIAIAVGGLLNKSDSEIETTDNKAIQLIAAITPAYTAFYPDDGSRPFPEIFKGISSSTTSSAPTSSGTKTDEEKIQLLRELINVYSSSTLSDTSKYNYPNFESAKTQLQTFKPALGMN